ncbi:phosphonate metabolism protein/1,5-bisphosphokinase (PRPP-forming) PhnN (plasmid) [Pseudorhodobacter turbinis]|uniref:Ribose 1,5-bisphosphate phosphokinase PhnN n=1 Tax=Pseudorhodobacter turbinis TaxID=2500533 RepID=A0A4P8EKW8_9RHOB|nr:phosphonate metabolism protein/1,5-bisphosphokinase (PRPP-forming) PhnN [Pseudorhodobacter turbinis]QCO57696.1 phosphonate metabolism protein/1,5-bisphosphokinase (PRPP-forming) PhnN [Pseudorhodobacter turbinis]
MTGGRLIAVVGPSGVGKDSIMAALASPQMPLVRRAITRAPGLGGEDYDAMTPADFAKATEAGAFCLHWSAHGLQYGIPAQVRRDVEAGADRIVNLSRGALGEAAKIFARLVVLHITASPETLAQRLKHRGREDTGDIAKRLASAQKPLPAGLNVIEIVNDGPLEAAVAKARAALQPDRV